MKTFLQGLFSSILGSIIGSFLALGLVVIMGFMILMMIISAFSNVQTITPRPNHERGALVMNLSMNISDSPDDATAEELLGESFGASGIPTIHLLDLTSALEEAAQDDDVKAIFIHGSLLPSNYGSGLATITDIRNRILKFKLTGKPVIAYLENPTFLDYYLASAADEIILHPFGSITLKGFSTTSPYLGNLMQQYGIGVQTTRVGKYKSAVEMFTREGMSDADREQVTALIESLWHTVLDRIALSRDMDDDTLRKITDNVALFTPSEAIKAGLADRTAYLDEVITEMQDLVGSDRDLDSFRQIGLFSYAASVDEQKSFDNRNAPYIAIVYAEGDIVQGEGSRYTVGGDWLARRLRELQADDEVKAVVLRINTPGGSATASEKILHQLKLIAETRPVVVSMGSYAASGGYWLTTSSDYIYAEETTITGSIGVWGLVMNVKELANKHGITWDGVKTSRYADLETLSRPKTKAEMELIQKFTDFIYDAFLERVANSRNMTIDEVKTIAQGRVWSGEDALKQGLVDEIGMLDDAIHKADELAGLEGKYRLMLVPETLDFSSSLRELFGSPQGEPPVAQLMSDSPWRQLVDNARKPITFLQSLNDPQHIYAKLPFLLEIH